MEEVLVQPPSPFFVIIQSFFTTGGHICAGHRLLVFTSGMPPYELQKNAKAICSSMGATLPDESISPSCFTSLLSGVSKEGTRLGVWSSGCEGGSCNYWEFFQRNDLVEYNTFQLRRQAAANPHFPYAICASG